MERGKLSYLVCKACSGFNALQSAFCVKCGRFLPRVPAGEKPERRREDRRDLALVGAMLTPDKDVDGKIFIENVCAGGLRFRCEKPLTLGQSLTVVVPLDGERHVVTGKVKHASEDAFGCVAGLQVTESDVTFRRHLAQLCLGAGGSGELVFS